MANEFQEVKVETPLSIIECGGVATICSGGDRGHWPLVHKNHASSMPF